MVLDIGHSQISLISVVVKVALKTGTKKRT
ncbi:hypothetical protein AGR2A_Lc70099 [Agrobacterium genomosp. 2 str. CFBP 5494]|uniref:Uncharacterized protein n=1 Tax=Agrobacterium genomosp. 2 str. CFBP 5494 TaxID=1183436 RepID=A0A9W5B5A7_9HYPH|nr:hypothetical protein AGR2A_Lc70099 [Agrobacterium genomosp. 2 str. CFBP 5494]